MNRDFNSQPGFPKANITRYIYVILTAIVLISVVIILILRLQSSKKIEISHRINQYHMVTINRCMTIMMEINEIKLWINKIQADELHRKMPNFEHVYENEHKLDHNTEHTSLLEPAHIEGRKEDRLFNFQYVLRNHLQHIKNIDKEFHDERFNRLLHFIEQEQLHASEIIDKYVSTKEYNYDKIKSALEPYYYVANQLKILHEKTIDELYEKEAMDHRSSLSIIYGLITILTIFGVTVVIIMLRQVTLAISAQAKAEEQMRVNELLLLDAQQMANIGHWDWDIKTNGLNWSDQIYRIFGHDPQGFEPTYFRFLETIHPEDRDKVEKAVEKALKDNDYGIEHRIVLPSGEIRHVHEEGNVTYDDDETPIRMLGTVQDITERMIAEEALRESEDRFRQIVERSSDVFYRQNINTNDLEYVSPKSADMLGYTPKYMMNMSIEERKANIHPDDLLTMENLVADVIEADITDLKSIVREFRFKKRSGEYIWIHGSYSLTRDVTGEPEFIVGALQDITDQKAADEEIRLQSEITQNMAKGVMMVGVDDGIIKYTNNKIEEMFGYESGDLLDKHISVVNAPTDNDPIETSREISRIIEETGEWHGEVHNIRKDGTTFWCSYDVTVFHHEKYGRVSLGVNDDITERKQADEKLKNLLVELQAANSELENFGYIVAHDLKAPLRGITSLSQWLLEDYQDVLDESGRTHLLNMSTRVNRLHKLTDAILEYSRVGQVQADVTNVDTGKILQSVISMLSPPNSTTIRVVGSFPIVQYDQTLLHQIFQNLIGNAIQHSDEKVNQIDVSSMEMPEYWEFCVKDNGTGIEEKHFQRIFKIFQSLNSNEENNSTGIGLSLVKKIVERNGGSVRVESVHGEGSSFFFTIPKLA